MHQETVVDLAPRAKKHGACQRVQARFRSISCPKWTSTHSFGAFVPTPCTPTRGAMLPASFSSTSQDPRSSPVKPRLLRTVQSNSPYRGSREGLCTPLTAHSAAVTSRHRFFTLLQCPCRCLSNQHLFMPLSRATSRRIGRGPADSVLSFGLIHKVIHTRAP